LLEAELATGRMHQIRVHAQALGYPVVGDTRYGGPDAERLYLHAHALRLRHPLTGAFVEVQSEPPRWAMPSDTSNAAT